MRLSFDGFTFLLKTGNIQLGDNKYLHLNINEILELSKQKVLKKDNMVIELNNDIDEFSIRDIFAQSPLYSSYASQFEYKR